MTVAEKCKFACVAVVIIGLTMLIAVKGPAELPAEGGARVCSGRYYTLLQACMRGGTRPHTCEDYLQWHFGGKCTPKGRVRGLPRRGAM